MFKSLQIGAIIIGTTIISVLPVYAANTSKMLSTCKGLAAKEYNTKTSNIAVKYEGQRTNGTHAVNGTYDTSKVTYTFQCSFNRAGTQVVDFTKNPPKSKVDEGAL